MIIEVEISDESYQPIVDAMCLLGNYRDEIDDGSGLNVMIPNPITNGEFAILEIKKILSERIRLAKTMTEQKEIVI